jgi:XTP/dITP diphosphohydrolase
MKTIIFATNNENKIYEVKSLVGDIYEVISLKEAGIDIDIPEPHRTLEANAREKSATIHKLTDKDCFSEDTGLEVHTLNGEPGVRSGRYAGEGKSSNENVTKLLAEMEGKPDRKARFRTVISLIIDNTEHQFEGVCEGIITTEPKGKEGFGYDPIFVPDGANTTFAEMSLQEKNTYSHRKKAIAKLLAFLSLYGKK